MYLDIAYHYLYIPAISSCLLMTQFNCHLNAASMCDIEHFFIFYYNYVFSCHLETVFMSHVDPVSISNVVTVIVPDKIS